MAAAIVEIEVRWRVVDSGAAWRVQRFPPTAGVITLTGVQRGVAYEGQARSIGVGGTASAWVPVNFVVASQSGTPLDQLVLDLDIEAGRVVVDCTLSKFRLTLNANVTAWNFANVPPAKTITIEIEQWAPGGHTIAWPATVVPVSGRAHVMTPVVGAVDIVTLTTVDGGKTWRQTLGQSLPNNGTVLGIALDRSTAAATSTTDGTTASAPSIVVAATVVNCAEPCTVKWSRVDTNGGADFLISDATATTVTFTVPEGTSVFQATQTWRCSVTDAAGAVASASVTVVLERRLQTSGALTLSPSPAFGNAVSPATPYVDVTAYLQGGAGTRTVQWTRVDTNGGSNFLTSQSGMTVRFRMSGPGLLERTQVWRCTVTDDTGPVSADVTVTLRSITAPSG